MNARLAECEGHELRLFGSGQNAREWQVPRASQTLNRASSGI